MKVAGFGEIMLRLSTSVESLSIISPKPATFNRCRQNDFTK